MWLGRDFGTIYQAKLQQLMTPKMFKKAVRLTYFANIIIVG